MMITTLAATHILRIIMVVSITIHLSSVGMMTIIAELNILISIRLMEIERSSCRSDSLETVHRSSDCIQIHALNVNVIKIICVTAACSYSCTYCCRISSVVVVAAVRMIDIIRILLVCVVGCCCCCMLSRVAFIDGSSVTINARAFFMLIICC